LTRGQAILLGLAVTLLGAAGYWAFQTSGLDSFSSGIAASGLLMLLVLGWTSSYLFRVVTGRMTYMQQRKRYRQRYDAETNEELEARFAALSPQEQQRLLEEIGQVEIGQVEIGQAEPEGSTP
jgi:hypothetical protein